MDNTLIAWANQSGFVVKTRVGKFIGPFNPSLYSPGITDDFSKFMDAEPKNTKLDKRTRQIVILTVGAVWNSPYEVYAHSAEARKVRVPEGAIQALASGESPEGLTSNELVAHRFARQLTAERRVDDDLYRKAKQAFGEEGLVDMIYLIGIYQVTCALLTALKFRHLSVPQAKQALRHRVVNSTDLTSSQSSHERRDAVGQCGHDTRRHSLCSQSE